MNDLQPAAPGPSQLQPDFAAIAGELLGLEHELRTLEAEKHLELDAVPAAQRESARNLVHYVALRQRDLRDLQGQLSRCGLSSLGRSESCVMGALLEVAARTQEALRAHDQPEALAELERLTYARGSALRWEDAADRLHRHTVDIFGPRPADRHIYIMVTAPSAEEADREWMVKQLQAGMNVLRINCAHEGEAEWGRMVDALEQARDRTGLGCRVIMDLAGPKIRTGVIESKRRVATWQPARDDIGNALRPARVVIRRASAKPGDERATLLIEDHDFAKLRASDELRFRDTRDKQRTLFVEELESDYIVASALERAYVLGHVEAQVRRGKKHRDDVSLEVADDPEVAIDVKTGDSLILTGRDVPGVAPERDRKGRVEVPGIVSCTLPAALDQLEVGQRVLFDDGKIHAVVERIKKSGDFLLRVTRTHKQTSKLRGAKGINLPDTRVTVPGLTDEDRQALSFVVKRADGVSLSFVRTVEDVRALHTELDRLGRTNIGVVLKIETRAGFEHLPGLLLEGLLRPPLAVMIARGDLAVEVGFERLAELQEEVLWLCEAAHVPAIWATQVLDTLARTGVPSRAEVTDASASVAAECVMLNKGAYIHEAVAVLSSILRRMEKHRYKKRSLFRKLEVSTFSQRP